MEKTVKRVIAAWLIFLVIFIFQSFLSARISKRLHAYKDLEFTSKMKGTNYEVSLANRNDPAQFCLQSGKHDLFLLSPQYFYIVRDKQIIHSVAVDNNRFEVWEELSGCWNIKRERDDVKIRLINFSNSSEIYFETTNTLLNGSYQELYQELGRLKNAQSHTSLLLFCIVFFCPLFIIMSYEPEKMGSKVSTDTECSEEESEDSIEEDKSEVEPIDSTN